MSLPVFRFVLFTLLFALSLSSASAWAEAGVEWISDPAALAEAGFDPEGPPIRRLLAEPDPRSSDEILAQRRQRSAAEVGGGEVRWATVAANDFSILSDEGVYTTMGNFWFSCRPSPTTTNRFADAPIHPRDDRRLRWLDVWMHDNSDAHNMEVLLYQSCQPAFIAGDPVVTELALISSSIRANHHQSSHLLCTPD